MKNITSFPYELEEEGTRLVAYEYIKGRRFSINISKGKIKLKQDLQFNKNNYGGKLDLADLWSRLVKIHQINEERLLETNLTEYTLECIFYDGPYMEENNLKPVYYGKGFIIVDLLHPDGVVDAKGFEQFCSQIGLPYAKRVYIGPIDGFRSRINDFRTYSTLSKDGIGAGIVIKNDPPQYEPNNGKKIKRFLLESEGGLIVPEVKSPPEDMAAELIRTIFYPDMIISLEETMKINPYDNKTKFRNLMIKYLNENHRAEMGEYFNRSTLSKKEDDHLDQSKINEFIEIIKKEIITYFEEVVYNFKVKLGNGVMINRYGMKND